MRYLTFVGLASIAVSSAIAADVQYSVIAFPSSGQNVGVSVGGQTVTLQQSGDHPNIFSGSAPSGDSYQYVIINGQSNTPETTTRKLAQGTTSTGNEFFNRSQTIYDVPDLPQAYNPYYPTLMTSLNTSNEVATIIMTVNATALDAYIKTPTSDTLKDANVTDFAYINSKEVYKFQGAGLSTSGQSTKDFSKQSWAIDFGKYNNNPTKDLLFGRSALKLRAEETDGSFAREKLTLDMLAAAGAPTLSGSWVRVFINNEAYGLFLLMDDASTHLIDDVLHGGDWKYPTTGATYKGNALSDTQEGNLVYIDDNQASYSADLYKLEDGGEDNTISKKNNTNARLVEFVKALSQINPSDATDAQHPGAIANLVDPKPTLTHIAINFLIGSWDGFWYQASNYYLNQDFGLNKWYLITYDFDEVFGNGVEDAGMNTVAYQNYSKPGSQRPLVTVFLNNTYYQGVFEDTLKTIVKKFFKPSVIDARLKAWEQMLAEDITWSRAISSQSPGTKTTFTLQDFKDGLLGTNGSTISISQWVTKRAEALTTQLNFKDTDDLPAIGPYTNGTHLDSNGNVVNGDGSSANGTSSGSNGSNGSDSSQSSASNRLTITGLTVASAFAVAALLL